MELIGHIYLFINALYFTTLLLNKTVLIWNGIVMEFLSQKRSCISLHFGLALFSLDF
jgi:hypothetical protein